MNKKSELKEEIFNKIKQYYNEYHKDITFTPYVDIVKYAGRVYNENEMIKAVDSILDFQLTDGKYCQLFSDKLKDFLGVNQCILTNSGSSANLLAISALTSKKLGKDRLKKGDEVITVSAGFPTTINPVIQNNLVPVFVDVDLKTYNINVKELEKTISKKTKCIFIAHTLGNPFNLCEVMKLCYKYNLYLIEDCCDSLGSKYNNQYTGTFGHISTYSFFPAHHITTGEGGAVCTNNDELAKIIKSFRDWGRDYKCDVCIPDCKKRYVSGYDCRYQYSHIGYNLKMTEMQAAIGSAQIDKLDLFINERKNNFDKCMKIFKKYREYFILPEAENNSDPSWFAFPLTIKSEILDRHTFISYLNKNKIDTRLLFAGNCIKQSAYENIKYRAISNLKNSDIVMNDTFFIGVYPGMTDEMFEYIEKIVDNFFLSLELV